MADLLTSGDLLTSFQFVDGGYRGVLRTKPGKPGLPERVVFWRCPHVHTVAGEARSCARSEKERLADTGTEIDLTAELDEAEAIVMGNGGGTRVTAQGVDDPADTESRVIKDDYNLVTDGDCYVANVQVYPESRTHVITVKNVGAHR